MHPVGKGTEERARAQGIKRRLFGASRKRIHTSSKIKDPKEGVKEDAGKKGGDFWTHTIGEGTLKKKEGRAMRTTEKITFELSAR